MVNPRLVPALACTLCLLLGGRLSAGVDRWTPLGPDGGAVTALAAPSGVDGLVFAGTETAGAFVSRDAGASWQPARSGLPSGQRIRFLTAGGRNGQLLFAVTGFEVYASEDGGISWKQRRLPRLIYGNVDMDLSTGILSFAASPDARSLFLGYRSPGSDLRQLRSTDGGRTWTKLALGPIAPYTPIGAIAIAPSNPDTIYMAVSDAPGRILRSTDNGSTWTLAATLANVSFFEIVKLAVHPRDANVLYAAYGDRIARSTDGGATWTQLSRPNPAPEHLRTAADLVIDPVVPETIYFAFNRYVPGYTGWYGGGITKFEGRIYRTSDGGASWSRIAVTDPVAALRIDGVQAHRIYAGVSRIGILRSENRGEAWSRANRGLMAASLCAVAPDPFTRDLLYISAGVCREGYEILTDNDDLGFLKGDPARNWVNLSSTLRNPVRSLEAYALVPDPEVPGTLYAATGHGLFASVNGGGQWESLQSGLEPILEAVQSLVIDPTDSRILYAVGYKLGYPHCGGHCPLEPIYGIARSTDMGVTWTKLLPTALVEIGLTIDPRDPRILYVPDGKGNLLKSTDRGATWVALPLRGFTVDHPTLSRLVVDPTAPQTLYAVAFPVRNYYAATLIKSTDGGRSWSPVGQGLPPGTEVRDVVLDPERPATLYAATNRGVFISDNAGGSWLPLGKKTLTNRDVRRVQVDPFDSATIYAGTEGDGGLFVLTRSDR